MTETKKAAPKKPVAKKAAPSKKDRVRIEVKGDPTVPGIAAAVKILREQGKEVDQVSLANALDQAVDLVISK